MLDPGLRVSQGPFGSLDEIGAFDPALIKLTDGTLRMYYSGEDGFNVRRMLSATSTNGLDWIKEPGVRIDVGDRPPSDPAFPVDFMASESDVVRLPDERLRMYYAGGSGAASPDRLVAILSAFSMDGLNWTKEFGIRLARGPSGSFDAVSVAAPNRIPLSDGRFRLLYVGSDGTFVRTLSAIADPATIEVIIDIKPQSCPNPLNTKSKGLLPIAILGSTDLDVTTIDTASVLLEGVSQIQNAYNDVATTFDGELCGCTTEGPDGFLDLTLKFKTQEIVQALRNKGEPLNPGDVVVLTLTGNLVDGTPFEGEDCMVVVDSTDGSLRRLGSTITRVFAFSLSIRNLFSGETQIRYQLPRSAHVTLKIYDLTGRLVRILVNEEKAEGYFMAQWNGRDNGGLRVNSGVYFIRMEARIRQERDFVRARKLILLR